MAARMSGRKTLASRGCDRESRNHHQAPVSQGADERTRSHRRTPRRWPTVAATPGGSRSPEARVRRRRYHHASSGMRSRPGRVRRDARARLERGATLLHPPRRGGAWRAALDAAVPGPLRAPALPARRRRRAPGWPAAVASRSPASALGTPLSGARRQSPARPRWSSSPGTPPQVTASTASCEANWEIASVRWSCEGVR